MSRRTPTPLSTTRFVSKSRYAATQPHWPSPSKDYATLEQSPTISPHSGWMWHASVAQCMLVMQMTICVVLRMVGGEDVKRNWFYTLPRWIRVQHCHNTGIASSSHHTMTPRTLWYSLDGLFDLLVISISTQPAMTIPNKLLHVAKMNTHSYALQNSTDRGFYSQDDPQW